MAKAVRIHTASRPRPARSAGKRNGGAKPLTLLQSFTAPNALGIGAGALCVIAAVIFFVAPFGDSRNPADLLREQDDWGVVSSPATFYLPGAINTVEFRSDGRIELHPTCKVNTDLLAKLTVSSRTIDRTLTEKLNRRLDVSGQMKDIISAGAEGAKTRSVNVSYQNSSILQVPYEDLLQVQRELIKGNCEEAIITNIKAGAIVCQTRAALQADLVYDIIYDESVELSEQGKLTAEAASKLKLQTADNRADRMLGNGLIYGVKLVPRPIFINGVDVTGDRRIGTR